MMSDGWLAVRFVHVVAMAFFVGGQLFLAAMVVPVERRNPDRERVRSIARRFGVGTLAAIAVLIATGSALAAHEHDWNSPTLQVKLGLVAVTAVFVFWHMRRPAMHALEAAIFLLSLMIVWLGLSLAHGPRLFG